MLGRESVDDGTDHRSPMCDKRMRCSYCGSGAHVNRRELDGRAHIGEGIYGSTDRMRHENSAATVGEWVGCQQT
jgi:hypothetical protein